jgi:hypothetical protein
MNELAKGTIELLDGVGIRVSLQGDGLRFDGPKETLGELAPVLREYKEVLLAALQEPDERPQVETVDGTRWDWKADSQGRHGWERANLRRWECWWRSGSFEDLPELRDSFFDPA